MNISSNKADRTHKGRHCKGSTKNYLKIQKLVLNVSKSYKVCLQVISGLEKRRGAYESVGAYLK